MFKQSRRRSVFSGSLTFLLLTAVYACGKSEGNEPPCDRDSECGSGECVAGVCVEGPSGSGGLRGDGVPGKQCEKGKDCASGGSGESDAGGGNEPGGTTGGTGSGSGGANSGPNPNPGAPITTPGPHFTGSGTSFRPLTTGCGPATADECTGACEARGGDPGTTVIRPPATLCFAGEGDPTPDDPAVVIEQVIESVGGKEYAHIRVTFDPAFTDNSYGEGSCCGWPEKRGHRFSDLTKSDHTELLLTRGDGETVMNFKVDLVTENPSSACGYGTLGVQGGDGAMLQGDPAHVLAVATSLDRNLNGCGYCEEAACGSSGDCTVDSPSTDDNYTPNSATKNWDYRQVYEVWIDMAAFGPEGFGQAYITYTHSSPAKEQDTITVEPTPCPPTWDTPYCPPSVLLEGGNCFGAPPSGGGGSNSGGSSGNPPNGTGGTGTSSGGRSPSGGASNGGAGGSGGTCPPNFQVYLATEGASLCTPIPFSNYPGMAPCPTGYTLDLASEGQYCLPNK